MIVAIIDRMISNAVVQSEVYTFFLDRLTEETEVHIRWQVHFKERGVFYFNDFLVSCRTGDDGLLDLINATVPI